MSSSDEFSRPSPSPPPAALSEEASSSSGGFIGRANTEDFCRHMVKQALEKDPGVKFMVQKMEEAGCGVGPEFFRVEHCDAQVGGGFRVPDGVVVCHNHLSSGEEVRHALLHELVHAYDHCRAADLDWSRCEHHACSEVRAAALSGDCNWKMELFRGNLGLAAQHRACARRRALISVSMNPACQGGRAQRAVDAAFERCFADTAPFERIP